MCCVLLQQALCLFCLSYAREHHQGPMEPLQLTTELPVDLCCCCSSFFSKEHLDRIQKQQNETSKPGAWKPR